MQAMEVDEFKGGAKRGAKRSGRGGGGKKKARRVLFGVPAQLRSAAHEVKSVDLNNGGAPPYAQLVSTTAVFTLLNGMVPGSNLQNRLGRKVALKSFRIFGDFTWNNGNNMEAANHFWCVMVVYDRQPNAAQFALADLLQSCDEAANTSSSVWDPINLSNRDRFVMLRDKKYRMETPGQNVSGSTADGQVMNITDGRWVIDEFVKLKNLETHFNTGNAGTIADITTGALYLVVVGSAASANSSEYIRWTGRTRFVDL